MKILLHHNVPKRLIGIFPDHVVKTAKEMEWDQLKNEDLLRQAELNGFELMITCDQNLSYQQNLTDRKIALIVLNTNNWNVLQRKTRLIVDAVELREPRSFRFLQIDSR